MLECVAIGLPTPVVQWIRLNKTDSTNTTVSTNGNLVINNSSLTDTGDYVCIATNIVGINTVQVPIKVMDPTGIWNLCIGLPLLIPSFLLLEVPMLRVLPDCIPCCNREISIPFGVLPELVTTSFDCEASGLPPPQYYWFINGTNVLSINATRYTVLPNGTLSILGVNASDDGNYQCLANNSVGSATAHFGASFRLSLRKLFAMYFLSFLFFSFSQRVLQNINLL